MVNLNLQPNEAIIIQSNNAYMIEIRKERFHLMKSLGVTKLTSF